MLSLGWFAIGSGQIPMHKNGIDKMEEPGSRKSVNHVRSARTTEETILGVSMEKID